MQYYKLRFHPAHGVLCSLPALLPLYPHRRFEGSAQGLLSPGNSKSPWVRKLKQRRTALPEPWAKASHTIPAGAPGAGQSRGSQPRPRCCHGESRAHIPTGSDAAWELWDSREKNHLHSRCWNWDCRAGPHPASCWRTRKRPDFCGPTALAWYSNFCAAEWWSQRIPLPKLWLWSRFLIGFSLELGTRTFSSYPGGCQTISFAPSLYGNLFPIFSHH